MNATDIEDYSLVISYLCIPKRLAQSKEELAQLRRDFYRKHSFVGSSYIIQDDFDRQSAYPVEYAVMDLIALEEAYKRQIKALSKRWEDFTQVFTQEEIDQLYNHTANYQLIEKAIAYVRGYEKDKETQRYEVYHQETIKRARRLYYEWLSEDLNR